MSVHQHRDGRWICTYKNEENKRKDRSFGRGPEAEARARQFDAQINSKPAYVSTHGKQDHSIPCEDTRRSMTFSELVSLYIRDCNARGISKQHMSQLMRTSKNLFSLFIPGDMPIDKITYNGHIVPLMTKIRTTTKKTNGEYRSPRTVNMYAGFLHAFFEFAVISGEIDKNPMRQWRDIKEDKRETSLTREDALRIWEFSPPYLQWAIEVAYNLGVRTGKSELLSLKWKDVDIEKREIRVYASKTKRTRYIPLQEPFLTHLKKMRDIATTPFIIERNGRPVSCLSRDFRKARLVAGITHRVVMYDLRALFTTQLIDSGASIGSISRLLGHAEVSTTLKHYYKPRKQEIFQAIEKLPSFTIK